MNQYEYQAELERLQRRRAISDELLKESFQPAPGTQMVGSGNVQLAVQQSPFEALARGLTPLAGAMQTKALDQRALDLKKGRGAEIADALTHYQDAIGSGTDKRSAATSLLSSVVDPEDTAKLIAADAFKEEKYGAPVKTRDGTFIQPSNSGGAPKVLTGYLAPPDKPMIATVGVEGTPDQTQTVAVDPRTLKTNPLGGPIKKQPGVQVSVGDTGEKALLRTVVGADVKDVKESEQAMRDAAINIQTMEAAKQDVPRAITGFGADARLNFARGIEMIFPSAEITDAVIGSQNFDAKMGDILLQQIRKLAPVTNEDIGILKNIIGSRSQNPNALVDLLTFLQNKSAMQIEQYNARNESIRSSVKNALPTYGYSGRVEIPEYDRTSTLDKIREELRKRGGK